MASKKKKKPSIVNANPITGPKVCMKAGHSKPSSNDNTVPDTAPAANNTAKALDQRIAMICHRRSPVLAQRHSANNISTGSPTPRQATTMCQPRVKAIWVRAAKRFVNSMDTIASLKQILARF